MQLACSLSIQLALLVASENEFSEMVTFHCAVLVGFPPES